MEFLRVSNHVAEAQQEHCTLSGSDSDTTNIY